MQYIAGITIAIFLSLLLIIKRKSKADYVLMCWLITLALHIGLYYIDQSGSIEQYSFLTGFSIPFPLLHGPFLFTYTSLLLRPDRKVASYWLHFLPFVLVNVALIQFYSLPASEKLYIFANDGVGYESLVMVNAILILLSGIIYFTISYLLINKHKKSIKDNLSRIEGKTLDWLRFLTIGLGVIWLCVLIGNNDLIFSGVVVFVTLIGIFGVKQNNIFSQGQLVMDDTQAKAKVAKYEKSGLGVEHKVTLIESLDQLIKNEKPFLNPELSLNDLAQKIDTQQNYLSQVLNEHFEMTFYDFINLKRVDEFCAKVNNNELKNYKLVEIAYECGFNSKSAFNRNFKRFIGKTPSEYIKNVSSGGMIPQDD